MRGALPGSSYRLQISLSFDLAAARDLVPYLAELGIDTLYSSPLLASRSNSPHGYDLVDPTRIDPEIGGEAGLERLAGALAARGMGVLLDVVVNHMAASLENPWWLDVLERGQGSRWASFFDIDWQALERDGEKLALPVLAAPWGEILESGQLKAVVGERGLALQVHGQSYPLAEESYRELLLWASEELRPGEEAAAGLREVLATTDEGALRRALLAQRQRSAAFAAFLDGALQRLAGEPGRPESYRPLERLMARQHYRLAFWRLAAEQLPYRRFFDISDLVGMRVELDEVFEALHQRLFELCRAGQVAGLRVDHVDGLRYPRRYLERLQARLDPGMSTGGDGAPPPAPSFYVVVEKILGAGEELPEDWPCHGTTGYDFMGALGAVFVEPRGLAALDRVYRRQTGRQDSFEEVRYRRKRQVLGELFGSELERITGRLVALARDDLYARDLPTGALGAALREVTACLPVYRTYLEDLQVPGRDRPYLEEAFAEARRRAGTGTLPGLALDFLARVMLLDPAGLVSASAASANAAARDPRWLDLLLDWQQLTGAVMAKGFEDTTLYVYNRLLSLNEVGGEPAGLESPGDAAAFHLRMAERARRWPAALSASSTHDSKRSEDVQARLEVLPQVADWWRECLERWRTLTAPCRSPRAAGAAPDPNEELYLYQTLLGSWPLEDEELPAYADRLAAHGLKALREAKVHSNWHDPDEAYEASLVAFIRGLVLEEAGAPFRADFAPLVGLVSWFGALGSLSRTLVKVMAPGVPDFYQGCELWDFSLVDPDNRRPVDFALRQRLLVDLQRRRDDPTLLPELLAGWRDGRVKLWLTWRVLQCRRETPALFAAGDYLPLRLRGSREQHVVAFARRHQGSWAVALAPRWLAALTGGDEAPLGAAVWQDTTVDLPPGAPELWRDALAPGEPEVRAIGGRLAVAEAMARFPAGLLRAS
jgi:(1->4)-alpha-D-glucan 1-alpha-D-glucosylmutase